MANRRLTEQQERDVCRLIGSGGMSYSQIGEVFGITRGLVSDIAERNGLTRQRNEWTEPELEWLRANYAKLGPTRCARRLRRHGHPGSVCHKASELGLTDHRRAPGGAR